MNSDNWTVFIVSIKKKSTTKNKEKGIDKTQVIL